MAKVQTRRSISVSRAEFEHAQNAARDAHMSLSQFTEIALRALVQLRASAAPVAVAIPVTVDDRAACTGGMPEGTARGRFVSDPDDVEPAELVVEYDE